MHSDDLGDSILIFFIAFQEILDVLVLSKREFCIGEEWDIKFERVHGFTGDRVCSSLFFALGCGFSDFGLYLHLFCSFISLNFALGPTLFFYFRDRSRFNDFFVALLNIPLIVCCRWLFGRSKMAGIELGPPNTLP